MIEIFTSDTAILFFSCAGLAVTAVSIVRDARTQHERQLVVAQGVAHTDNVRQLVTEDVRAEAA